MSLICCWTVWETSSCAAESRSSSGTHRSGRASRKKHVSAARLQIDLHYEPQHILQVKLQAVERHSCSFISFSHLQLFKETDTFIRYILLVFQAYLRFVHRRNFSSESWFDLFGFFWSEQNSEHKLLTVSYSGNNVELWFLNESFQHLLGPWCTCAGWRCESSWGRRDCGLLTHCRCRGRCCDTWAPEPAPTPTQHLNCALTDTHGFLLQQSPIINAETGFLLGI